jgi:hypothetical protein
MISALSAGFPGKELAMRLGFDFDVVTDHPPVPPHRAIPADQLARTRPLREKEERKGTEAKPSKTGLAKK